MRRRHIQRHLWRKLLYAMCKRQRCNGRQFCLQLVLGSFLLECGGVCLRAMQYRKNELSRCLRMHAMCSGDWRVCGLLSWNVRQCQRITALLDVPYEHV